MDAQPTKDITQIHSAELSARGVEWIPADVTTPPHSLITFGISYSKWIWILSLPSGCHNYNLIQLWNRNNSVTESELGLFRRMKTTVSSKDAHRKMSLDVRLQDLYAKALRLRGLKDYIVPSGVS